MSFTSGLIVHYSGGMENIDAIIAKAGGPDAIARESKNTLYRISACGVQKWRQRGRIPDEHWDLIMRLSGVSMITLYRLNKARRSRPAA